VHGRSSEKARYYAFKVGVVPLQSPPLHFGQSFEIALGKAFNAPFYMIIAGF
jgi:hypothetical protein